MSGRLLVRTDVNARVGAEIRRERERQGIRQVDLARAVFRSSHPSLPTTWGRIEAGTRTITLGELIATAEVLGVVASTLFPEVNR